MQFDVAKIPKKIHFCPIVESVAELQFDSNLPSEMIIGVALNTFKNRYPNIEKLPIMEMPAFFRENTPSFMFAPHYKLKNNDFILQIGAKSFSIVHQKEYKGWHFYKEEIIQVFTELNRLNLINGFNRIGLRYINFFENVKILDNLKIEFMLAGNKLSDYNSIVRSEFLYSDFKCIIQIANEAKLENVKNGSSIDIDIIYEKKGESIDTFLKVLEEAHELERKIFFSILKEGFLNTLKPEY